MDDLDFIDLSQLLDELKRQSAKEPKSKHSSPRAARSATVQIKALAELSRQWRFRQWRFRQWQIQGVWAR